MAEDSDSQTSHDEAPTQNLAGIPMVERIRIYKSNLEEIRKQLKPGNLSNVLNTTVKVWINDISEIFDYFEEIEETEEDVGTEEDVLNYISSVSILNSKLREIMRKLQGALNAWNMSKEGTSSEKSEAFDVYLEHLDKCYDLLKDALACFISVEQSQQGTTSEGNTEPMRKTP